MTELRYRVNFTMKDKGIAYAAKHGLITLARQEGSGIKQVRFNGEPTSNAFSLDVTVYDRNENIIRDAIARSGRMPTNIELWSIESVTLLDGHEAEDKNVAKEKARIERQLKDATAANEELRQKLAAAEATKISTALDGLLAYFATCSYTPVAMIADPVDRSLARAVFAGEKENTLEAYVSHHLGKPMLNSDIMKILTLDAEQVESAAQTELVAYHDAVESLVYLQRLEKGEIADMPSSVVQLVMNELRGRNLGAVIQEYEAKQSQRAEQQKLHESVKRSYGHYAEFNVAMELLRDGSGEIPVIFNCMQPDTVQVFFPFQVAKITSSFIEDLGRDIATYFRGETVPVQHTFVAYSVKGIDCVGERIGEIIDDMPSTLQLAGFNRIVPHRLG